MNGKDLTGKVVVVTGEGRGDPCQGRCGCGHLRALLGRDGRRCKGDHRTGPHAQIGRASWRDLSCSGPTRGSQAEI
jgi:hypothetical protein